MPPPGQSGRQCYRSCILIGEDVYIVQKKGQRTGQESKGTVSRVLTNAAYHPRGIKVMLAGGEVGRVTRFSGGAANVDGAAAAISTGENNILKKISLADYLRGEGVDGNLSRIVKAAADASSRVANDLRKLSLLDGMEEGGNVNVQGEEQKGMNVRANTIFLQQLKPVVAAIWSQKKKKAIAGDASSVNETSYAIAFDPLDGSSNLDIAAPTGSIFDIFCHSDSGSPFGSPARQSMVAAGYTVYSSATELVIAGLGENVVGFTLDMEDGIFRCSRPNIVCPERGPYYSLNEAQEPDCDNGLAMPN